MPDLSLTTAQELLRNSARDFIARECPLSAVRRIDEQEEGFSRDLWRATAALGWPGILVPEAYGGGGTSLTDAAVLYEELGRGLLPGPYLASGVLAASILLRAASDDRQQQQRLLPAIASGQRIAALAFTEADYGWGPEHVSLTATADGGRFVLSGAKRFVAHAGAADDLLIVARTARGGGPEHGLSLFLVPVDAPGVARRRVRGFLGDPLFDVDLDGVTGGELVGAVDGAWEALSPALDDATAVLCAYVAGASRKVYEMSLDYAQQRVQFGQPIARFQRVQDHLIDMLNHADAARWTAYEAVWKLEHGLPAAREAVSVAKAVASEGFYQACEAGHHLHAGIGSEKGYGLYLYTQKSRSLYHELGDPAFHRRRLARELRL